MYFVYQVRNIVNNKIYVGVHNYQKNNKYLGSGVAIKEAVKKYGRGNFEKLFLFICDSKEDAFWLESIIVNEYFVRKEDTYNISLGGTYTKGMWGKTHSNETKRKIGLKSKTRYTFLGKKHSLEVKNKISEIVLDKWRDPNYRKVHAESMKKVWKSKEVRNKISKAHKGKFGKVVLQFTKEWVFIAEYPTIVSAAQEVGVHPNNLSNALRGATKTSGGYKWRYK